MQGNRSGMFIKILFGNVVDCSYLCIVKRRKNMGYTHYFKFKGGVSASEIKDGALKFKKASDLIKKLLKRVEEEGITISGGDGHGEPFIDSKEIWFNGSAERHEDYETFYLNVNKVEDFFVDGKMFCKTQHMPYDLLVCLSLLAFNKFFGDDFEFRSDGGTNSEEWKTAHEIWKKIVE